MDVSETHRFFGRSFSGCSWIVDGVFCAFFTVNFEDASCKMEMRKKRLRFMIAGCSDLCFCLMLVKEHHLIGNFFPQEEKCLIRASGDVRGVARRRCSDHWYSGDWDQVEEYPFSSWLSFRFIRWVLVNNDGWAVDILWKMMRCYGSWHVYLHDSCIWEVPEHMNVHMYYVLKRER